VGFKYKIGLQSGLFVSSPASQQELYTPIPQPLGDITFFNTKSVTLSKLFFMKTTFALLTLILFSTSCTSYKLYTRNRDVELDTNSYSKIDGKYINRIPPEYKDGYPDLLFPSLFSNNKEKVDSSNAIVEIEALSTTRLKISLIVNDSLVKTKE
jgi:hypothetical protein